MKDYNDSKKALVNIATGVLVGAVIGGGLAMLLAPDSGKNNRKYLSKQAKKIADKVSKSAQNAGETVKDSYNKVSESVKDTYSKMAKKASV